MWRILWRVLLSSIELRTVFIGCLARSLGFVRIWTLVTLAHISVWFLITSTTFLSYTVDTVVALGLFIDSGSVSVLFGGKFLLLFPRTNRRHAEKVLQHLSYPIQFKVSCMQQVNNFFRVPLSTTITQLRYHLGPVIDAGSCMFFLYAIFSMTRCSCNTLFYEHIKVCKSVMPFSTGKGPPFFIACNTLNIQEDLLMPTFQNAIPHIEKSLCKPWSANIRNDVLYRRSLVVMR